MGANSTVSKSKTPQYDVENRLVARAPLGPFLFDRLDQLNLLEPEEILKVPGLRAAITSAAPEFMVRYESSSSDRKRSFLPQIQSYLFRYMHNPVTFKGFATLGLLDLSRKEMKQALEYRYSMSNYKGVNFFF